jgi:hypothetical protein
VGRIGAPLVCAIALAGCGSAHTGATAAPPSAAVPASVPLYAEAVVRPEGALKSRALAVGRALTHGSNPYLALLGALQTPGSPRPAYAGQVAPWLGARAGIFLTSTAGSEQLLKLAAAGLLGGSATSALSFGSGGLQGAVLLDVSSAAGARSFLARAARRAGAHSDSYRGVAYEASSGGLALGMVGSFAVIGSEAALRSVIDTTLGGASLARSQSYRKLVALAPPQTLAHLYSDPPAAGLSQAGEAGMLALLAGSRQSNISLVPGGSSAQLDADSLTGASSSAPGGLLSAGAQGAGALEELPSGSWLALGLGDLGQTLGQDASALAELSSLLTGSGAPSTSGAGALVSLESIVSALVVPLQALGANTAQARTDFTSWMSSGGIFASGSGLLELKAAVAINSTDPARSRAAVAKLAGALRRAGDATEQVSLPGTEAAAAVHVSGLPLVLYIADGRASNGRTKLVLGLGEASVAAALAPPGTLAGSATLAAAAAHLGAAGGATAVIEVPTLVGLLESLQLTEEPSLAKYVPALRAITTLDAGARQLSPEVQRLGVYVGLREAG